MKILFTLLFFILSTSLFAENFFPIITNKIKINMQNEGEVREVIGYFLQDEQVISSVFDKIEKGSIQLSLINDYNFKDPNSADQTGLNDDLGLTHGYKIQITKNIAPTVNDNYYLTISFESNLHTNSNDPAQFKEDYRELLYLNESGMWQADVYFKEENLFKIIIGKIPTHNAFYWNASLGYQEINAEDSDRGFIISSIAQQKIHHRYLNKKTGGDYREYNYLSQDGVTQKSAIIEAELGRDETIYAKGSHRIFARGAAQVRISGVDDASYVGVEAAVGHEFTATKRGFIPSVRLMGGLLARKYSKGSYRHSFVELVAENKGLFFKLKYIKPLTDEPDYLNPLPEEFEARDLNVPLREPLIQLSVEGRFN